MNTLHAISVASLIAAAACALMLLIEVVRHPQRMKIMNVVWPISGLYGGPLALIAYAFLGRRGRRDPPRQEPPPSAAAVVGSSHCGAGCTLGDVAGEFGVYLTGLTIAGQVIWAYLVVDFVLSWMFGIVFQYLSIVPMRHLSFRKGVVAAIKADTLSIAAFQAGMYGWMLLARFVILHRDIPPTRPEHWFSMQIAMVIGIATTFPMNLWLIRKGWKEKM